jgi:hypothetical protein
VIARLLCSFAGLREIVFALIAVQLFMFAIVSYYWTLKNKYGNSNRLQGTRF